MSKEAVSVVDWPCYRDLRDKYLDGGFDSNVYRFDNFVVKAYRNGSVGTEYFGHEYRIFLYVNITNEASRVANASNIEINFPYSHTKRVLSINPVLGVRKCSGCGLIEALSAFIPGKNLNMTPYKFDLKELDIVLRNSGYLLEEKLKVRGIKIIASNVKELDEENFVVTDLCANTLDLKRV